MDENLPVLLSFFVDENVIKLRLDSQGLLCFDLTKQTVCELELNNRQHLEKLNAQLEEADGQVLEHDISYLDNKVSFRFWSDYGRIENEINCKSINQSFSQYTKNDLARKGSLLANHYTSIYKSLSASNNRLFDLTSKLETEILDETTRFQRKADFYKDKSLVKSEAFTAGIKVLEKLLSVVKPNPNF